VCDALARLTFEREVFEDAYAHASEIAQAEGLSYRWMLRYIQDYIEGFYQGYEEGYNRAFKEVVCNMLEYGYTVEDTAKYLQVSIDSVEHALSGEDADVSLIRKWCGGAGQ